MAKTAYWTKYMSYIIFYASLHASKRDIFSTSLLAKQGMRLSRSYRNMQILNAKNDDRRKIVFLGTPEISANCLQYLTDVSER